mgnify:FL=1
MYIHTYIHMYRRPQRKTVAISFLNRGRKVKKLFEDQGQQSFTDMVKMQSFKFIDMEMWEHLIDKIKK